jgi:protein N-terminal amidase
MFDETQITDFLEDPRKGITFQLSSHLAKWLKCYVFAGYPERLDRSLEDAEEHQEGANSAHIVGPDGTSLSNYRKTNLFSVDKCWAKPGSGFAIIDLPAPLNVRVVLGICMDLNPQPPNEWTSIDGTYELASFAKENEADLLILLNAWLASDQKTVLEDEPDEPDMQTFSYWYARLKPLWSKEDVELSNTGKGTIVVICNRCGREKGVFYLME